MAELDIQAMQGLSHPVHVEVKGGGTDVNFGPSSAIFDDWDWSSGKIQLQSSTLRNNVNVYDPLSLTWQYRVKQRDGSWSAWINMNQSDHVLYTVDSQPAATPLYDLGVDKACRYANGASDFVGAINSGVAAELLYAMAETSHDLAIFNLGGGQCCCQAGVFCQLVSHVTSSTPVVVYGWAGCAPDKQCVYFWNNQYASFQCQRPAHDSVETNSHFLFHAVAQHNGTIYDSSYGVVGWPTILEMAPSIPGKHPNRDSFQTGPSLPFSSIVDWTCPH